MEWVKPLLSVDISGGQGEAIIENCYSSIQKVTKSKPEISIKPENWTLKMLLDVHFNLPPDETEQEEEEDKKKARIKIKYDDGGFPTVPWPEAKLDQMSKEELIEYIRVCKRALKQGGAIYNSIRDRVGLYDEKERLAVEVQNLREEKEKFSSLPSVHSSEQLKLSEVRLPTI